MKLSLASVIGVVLAALLMLSGPRDSLAQTTPSFPERGKAISIYCGFAAGGASDISLRLFAGALEKEVGVPVQVVGKPGAASQMAMTALALSKPDGYTLGQGVFPAFLMTYLDPTKKASYGRKSFQAVAQYAYMSQVLAVKSDRPYKTLKDLVEAARANSEKITVGTSGILSSAHLTPLLLERAAGVKFAFVHFAGSGEGIPRLLGGHIEVQSASPPEIGPYHRSGEMRVLASTAKESDKVLPGVKTFVEQGYPVTLTTANGLVAPAGTPREIVQFLSRAAKKVVESPEFQEKAKALGLNPDYLDTPQFETSWANRENEVRPLIESSRGN